jgi:diguanylate cyclase
MVIHYDFWLILLSALASSLAMFATFSFIHRLYLSTISSRNFLLPVYTLTVGSGLWGIDFINLLAFNNNAIFTFSLSYLFASWLAAIVVGFITCYVASQKTVALSLLTISGLFAGLGSYVMFYLCANALNGTNNVSIIPTALFSALLTSICISFLALITLSWMKQYDGKNALLIKTLLSLVTAVAIIGLHITFSASIVTDANSILMNTHQVGSKKMLATMVSLMIACLFLMVILAAVFYEKFGSNLFKLNFVSPSKGTNALESKDVLTQLPNRHAFRQLLDTASIRCTRSGNTIALAYIDLDHFKPINDSYGHHVGDAVLKIVAQRLQTAVRGCDSVARLGGDEFAALIEGIESDTDIIPIMERIVSSISLPFYVNNQQIDISCSVGIALYPRDGNIEKLIVSADSAMYKAKQNGKNQFKFYDADIELSANQMLEKQGDLRNAIDNNQFVLMYQPKLDCNTQLLVGAEALIRWNHPTKGLIMPKDFIAEAEHFGLIDEISNWVAEQACKTISQAKSHGIDLNLSINTSKHLFRNKNYVSEIITHLEKYNVPAKNLTLEIKETSGVRDEALFNQHIVQFKTVGVKIALDDFGLHPFTLSYLQDLNVDEIKIDKIFMAAVKSDPESWKLVDVLINLAHLLHINVVAEGIENEVQYNMLKQLGCNHMQGYLFSQAITEAKLYDYCKQHQLNAPTALTQYAAEAIAA